MPLESGKQALSEKDFIHEEYGRNPFRLWKWLIVVVGASFLFAWGLASYQHTLAKKYKDSPFLQVTNRQFSLFLWQNPGHMRAHAKNKNGYLPAFRYNEKIGLTPEYADDYVAAPPEVLFLYHTWQRLISHQFSPHPIPANEFRYFLQDVEEWQPRYWKQAPQDYIELTRQLENFANHDLNVLSKSVMPLEVRQAFTGWKNYFYEGNLINQLSPTYSELDSFIEMYPHYARNFWRNIAGRSYLKSFPSNQSTEKVPKDEISPFLRFGVYNYIITDKIIL